MNPLIHGSLNTVSQIVLMAIWLFGVKAMSFDASELDEILGQAVLAGFVVAKLTIKSAAVLMEITPANLAKCLRAAPRDSGKGFHHISLNRLVRAMPTEFWAAFGPALIYLAIKRHTAEIVETFSVRKSAVRKSA